MWAISRTWGPIRIPSTSSSTTTGGAHAFGTTATMIAASAATTTVAKNDPVSTWIAASESAVTAASYGRAAHPAIVRITYDSAWTVLGGESAVPCNPQSALAGPNSRSEGLAVGVSAS